MSISSPEIPSHDILIWSIGLKFWTDSGWSDLFGLGLGLDIFEGPISPGMKIRLRISELPDQTKDIDFRSGIRLGSDRLD